jgi:hypothetical protein
LDPGRSVVTRGVAECGGRTDDDGAPLIGKGCFDGLEPAKDLHGAQVRVVGAGQAGQRHDRCRQSWLEVVEAQWLDRLAGRKGSEPAKSGR